MNPFDGEIFERVINESFYTIVKSGPLHEPITSMIVERDDDLRINLKSTTSNTSKEFVKENYPEGTVRNNNDLFSFSTRSGAIIEMNGINPYSFSEKGSVEKYEKAITSSIHRIFIDFNTSSKGKYLIEWLENVDDGTLIYPDLYNFDSIMQSSLSIGNDVHKIVIPDESKERRGGRSLAFAIADHTIYFCTREKRTKGVRSGFLLYNGVPAQNERDAIRNCISFLLGRPLVCCGNTIYDEKWRINSTEAISPNTNNGSFFRISSLIPVPLSQYAMNMPDSNIFEKYINALYRKYNEFNLLHVFWLYFYALSSPLHVAGVQFGAAIEAIQKSYNDGHQKKYNNALLNKPKWKEFYDKVLGVIDDLDIAADKASILKNKLSNLNQTPQSLKNEDFFKLLGLELSQLEIDAWQRRNDSAHGNRIEDEDYVKMIKDIKLLKLMFHRILLSMVGNFKYYVDYYSVNYPIRKLQSPVQ